MDEDNEGGDKSENLENNNSKVSLKVSANEGKLVSVKSLIQYQDNDRGAGPSSGITTEIILSYNYYNEDSTDVSQGVLQNVLEKVVRSSKAKQRCVSVQSSSRAIVRNNNDVSITPPTVPPVVLYTAPPLHGAPPTYSAIMRIGPTETQTGRSPWLFGRREQRIQPSPPFIAPIPPPSYNESQGIVTTQPPSHNYQIDYQESFGPHPISLICPNCSNFVITTTRTRRSNLTHFSALALCLCGCWPCCLLPYCLNSCKSTYHECPVCFYVIGFYNPWIVSSD